MKFSKRLLVFFVFFILTGCTTEPYKKSLAGFAEGMGVARAALIELDRRNTEALQLRNMASTPNWRLAPCVLNQPCGYLGIPEAKPIVPEALLAMAKVVTYVNGLAELAAAKDTAAISAATGKINKAAAASIKSFGSSVRDGTLYIASFDLVAAIADEIIAYQRLQELKSVMIKNKRLIESTMDRLAVTAEQLRATVFKHESDYILVQDKARRESTSYSEQRQLEELINRRQTDLGKLSTTNAGQPFKAMKASHRAILNAINSDEVSPAEIANKILDFVEKAQALDSAVKKSAS